MPMTGRLLARVGLAAAVALLLLTCWSFGRGRSNASSDRAEARKNSGEPSSLPILEDFPKYEADHPLLKPDTNRDSGYLAIEGLLAELLSKDPRRINSALADIESLKARHPRILAALKELYAWLLEQAKPPNVEGRMLVIATLLQDCLEAKEHVCVMMLDARGIDALKREFWSRDFPYEELKSYVENSDTRDPIMHCLWAEFEGRVPQRSDPDQDTPLGLAIWECGNQDLRERLRREVLSDPDPVAAPFGHALLAFDQTLMAELEMLTPFERLRVVEILETVYGGTDVTPLLPNIKKNQDAFLEYLNGMMSSGDEYVTGVIKSFCSYTKTRPLAQSHSGLWAKLEAAGIK